MTRSTPASVRTLGTVRSADGQGIVRLEDRLDAAVDDVWSAFTDRRRLAQWLGELEGDLRQGAELRAVLRERVGGHGASSGVRAVAAPPARNPVP